ncbi:MAG: FAD-dependent oxidoreductase [Pseudomonadota bacterium]
MESAGAPTDSVGLRVEERVAFDLAGHTTHRLAFPQIVTSWDRLQSLIRATVPDLRYHLGHRMVGYTATGSVVRVEFDKGFSAEADLLVGADGYRSSVHRQAFPEVQPAYAGYIAWRGVAAEADLPDDLRASAFSQFSFFLPAGDGLMLAYPIAGADNDLSVGHRRYHWGWYRLVDPGLLPDLLTDERGVTHAVSIPPPLVRRVVIQQMRDAAEGALAPQFAAILEQVKAPFFTPIYDHAAPSLVSDRVALVGDAPVLARPHIGAGVTKAAADAVALVACLSAAGTLAAGLAAYNAERLPLDLAAYQRSRYLGEYLTPRYRTEAEKADWARRHNIEAILQNTAVLDT